MRSQIDWCCLYQPKSQHRANCRQTALGWTLESGCLGEGDTTRRCSVPVDVINVCVCLCLIWLVNLCRIYCVAIFTWIVYANVYICMTHVCEKIFLMSFCLSVCLSVSLSVSKTLHDRWHRYSTMSDTCFIKYWLRPLSPPLSLCACVRVRACVRACVRVCMDIHT